MLGETEVRDAAYRVVNDTFVGLMTTVDGAGRPHSRYMAAAPTGDDLRGLLSVSGKSGRKLEHLEANPHVCWVFSDPTHREVVTLKGTAHRLANQSEADPVWMRLTEATYPYAMNVLSEPENLWFVGIETRVETVEYLCPGQDVTSPMLVRLGRE